jgi:hypothetical protein
MAGQTLPFLPQVFLNELVSMDLDVKRLQVAYLNTILMSPFQGVVTGVYKNPGDPVSAGEPVIRVENNATILLVGTLVYRDRIATGGAATVQTALFDASGGTTTLSGQVVSARGHRHEDERWDVVVQCRNLDSSGNPVVPSSYHFDYDNTTVTIA